MNVQSIFLFRKPRFQPIIVPMVCLLVALTFSFTQVPVAYAAEFNPGCTGTIGDAAQLQASVITANSNGVSDSINLVKGCTYVLTATLSITADGGQPLAINGNGATIDGDKQFTVFNVAASSVVNINRVKIKGGNTTAGGGGIANAGVLNLTTVSLTGNKATGVGGGIANTGTVHITDTTLSGNSTTEGNGGGIGNAGTVTLTNSTLYNNKAPNGSGGGIANSGTFTLTNSTLSANKADSGGGLFSSGGTVNLRNTIIANSAGGDCANSGTITPSGGNLIEDGSCSVAGALSGDPKLGKLAGSPAYLPLMPGSKAIDKGGNSVCTDPDQRGKIRPQDGDGNGSKICDLGSYEKTATTGAELLTNGGFEAQPIAPWGVNNGSGDVVVCKPSVAYTGNCAFAFKGSATEKATLVQTINVTNRNFNNGDVVRLSMMVKASNLEMDAAIEIQVLYPGSSTPGKTKLPLRKTNGYEEFIREVSHLDPGLMTITLRIANKSKVGTIYVDAVSLRHVKSNQLLIQVPGQ